MSRMDYVDWKEASDTLESLAEHGPVVQQVAPRPWVLYYGGRRVGAFTTTDAAQDELERLSRLAMKRGEIPKSFRIEIELNR